MKENIFSQGISKNKTALPLGVFDSGVGGLTVVREILNLLPQESIVYLGDTARVPYGNKSPKTVLRFTPKPMISTLSPT